MEKNDYPIYHNPVARIDKFSQIVDLLEDSMVIFAKQIEEADEIIKELEGEISEDINLNLLIESRDVMELGLLVIIIILDICTVYLQFDKAGSLYEQQTALKHAVVIVNESYKRLYDFPVKNNPNERKKSILLHRILPLIKGQQSLEEEFNSIIEKLDNFFESYFLNIKDRRNLSVHYDERPSRNFGNLATIHPDYVFYRIHAYYDILCGLYVFNGKLVELIKSRTDLLSIQLNNYVSELEKLR